MKRLLTEVLRNQFDSTFHMSRVLVKVCPNEVWTNSYNESDVIVGQIRHIMYNIGYLNGILRELGLPEWD